MKSQNENNPTKTGNVEKPISKVSLLDLQKKYNEDSKRIFLSKSTAEHTQRPASQSEISPPHALLMQPKQHVLHAQQTVIHPQQHVLQPPTNQKPAIQHTVIQPPMSHTFLASSTNLNQFHNPIIHHVSQSGQGYFPQQLDSQPVYPSFSNMPPPLNISSSDNIFVTHNQMLPRMTVSQRATAQRNNSELNDEDDHSLAGTHYSGINIPSSSKYLKKPETLDVYNSNVFKTKSLNKKSHTAKDQIILKLSKQLQVYKNLASKYTPKDELEKIKDEELLLNEPANFKSLALVNVESDKSASNSSIGSDQNGKIDLKLNTLNYYADSNIFEDNFVFEKNWYINSLYKQTDEPIENKNKEFYKSLLKFPYVNNFQKEKATHYIGRLIYDDENSSKRTEDQVEQKNKEEDSLKHLLNSFTFDDEDCSDNCVENEVENETPSPYLAKIIQLLNTKLPKYKLLKFLKKFYFNELYISLPCFDITALEFFLKEVLVVDPITDAVTVKLEGTNIRDKIANIAIICLILKVSDMVIKHRNKTPIKDGISEKHLLKTAIILLTATDPENYQSEHVISGLSLVWSVCCFLPDSKYFFNFIAGNSTVKLAHYIYRISLKFELFDLGDKPELQNNALRYSHCEKIQIFVIKMIKIAKFSNGHTKELKDIDDESKTQKLFTAKYHCNNELDTLLITTSLKFVKFLTLLNDCYSILYSSNNGGVSLKQITRKLDILNNYVTKTCSFEQWCTPGLDFTTIGEDAIIVDKAVLTNTLYLDWICLHRATVLRIYHVLIMAVKDKFINENIVFDREIAVNHLFLSVSLSIGSVLMLEKYVKGQYKGFIVASETITIGKFVSMVFNKIILTLISFTIRVYVYRLYLYKLILNDKQYDHLRDLELTDLILKKISQVLFKTCKLYSKKYRFYYFKSFKFCLFLDFFQQLYNDGTLYNHLFQTNTKFDPDSPLPEYIVNHKLMRMVFEGDFLKLGTSITDLLNDVQVQEFLKEREETNTSSESILFDNMVTSDADVQNVFDDFSFASLFKDINFEYLDIFNKDFF